MGELAEEAKEDDASAADQEGADSEDSNSSAGEGEEEAARPVEEPPDKIFLSSEELRSALPDQAYRLRVGNIVYGPVDVDGLVPLLKQGLLVAVSGISADGGDWQPPSEHPALGRLRKQLAHGIRDQLEIDREFVSRAGASVKSSREEEDDDGGGCPEPESGGDEEGRSLPPTPPVPSQNGGFDGDGRETTNHALPSSPGREADDAAGRLQGEEPDVESSEDSGGGPQPPPVPPSTRDDACDRTSTSSSDPVAPDPPSRSNPSLARSREEGARRDTAEVASPVRTELPSETTEPRVEAGEGESESSGAGRAAAMVSLLVAVTVGIGAAAYAVGPSSIGDQLGAVYESIRGAWVATPMKIDERGETSVQQGSKAPSSEVRSAVSAAAERIASASDVDPSDPDVQLDSARRIAADGRARVASEIYDRLWKRRGNRVPFVEAYLDVLLDAGRLTRARGVAIEGIQRFEEEAPFVERYRKTLRLDEELSREEPVDLDSWDEWGTIRRATSRDFEGFVIADSDGRPAYLFAPSDGGERAWRDDVAAWRLCRMIQCRFELPKTRPARISRRVFEQRREGDADFPDLEWLEETGPGGESREYLYGSLRASPGEVARWPLEARDVWYDWLSDPGEPKDWDRSLSEIARGLNEVGERDFADAVLERAGEVDVRELAAQLSDIFVFDYLTNNWNRFRPDNPGAYNHVGRSGFVTIRTETALQLRNSTRVKGRFEWISQFRRDTVTALRSLDPDALEAYLYPNPSQLELEKLEILRGQRRRLLERVDELVAEHGIDGVFPFD